MPTDMLLARLEEAGQPAPGLTRVRWLGNGDALVQARALWHREVLLCLAVHCMRSEKGYRQGERFSLRPLLQEVERVLLILLCDVNRRVVFSYPMTSVVAFTHVDVSSLSRAFTRLPLPYVTGVVAVLS